MKEHFNKNKRYWPWLEIGGKFLILVAVLIQLTIWGSVKQGLEYGNHYYNNQNQRVIASLVMESVKDSPDRKAMYDQYIKFEDPDKIQESNFDEIESLSSKTFLLLFGIGSALVLIARRLELNELP